LYSYKCRWLVSVYSALGCKWYCFQCLCLQ
jgi:hypothetical protein